MHGERGGPLAGVPTLVKDNTEVRGWPSGNGSAAYVPRPARAHSAVAEQLLATGMDLVGTTRMPEYGLNASTEFADAEPTRNPWDTRYSAGASSGGAAALVAAGRRPDRARERRRRLDPHPGRGVRSGRAEADARAHGA